jgi:type IV pilus assembly protein PilZ
MFDSATKESFKDGQVIFREGTSGDWIYIILSGSVEISKTVNNKKFIIEVLKEGDLFGGASFLGMIERKTTAIAIGKTSIGIVDRTPLDEEFNKLSSEFRTVLLATVLSCNKVIDRACKFTVRKHPRVKKSLALSYQDHSGFVKAYTGNISQGGLFIKTKKPLEMDEEFLLKLTLPGIPNSLNIKSKVMWVRKTQVDVRRPAGMGVQFCKMATEEYTVLKQYLKTVLGRTS